MKRKVIKIDLEKCNGCRLCIPNCPEGALQIIDGKARLISDLFCDGLGACIGHCPQGAIEIEEREAEPYDEKRVMGNIIKHIHPSGCPGARMVDMRKPQEEQIEETGKRNSELKQWPIQLHLISPSAPYFKNADVLLCADCVGYAVGDFHKDFLKGKSIAIACPKLDEGQEEYAEKIKTLVEQASINTLTVAIMEVPCCMGLLHLAQQAASSAKRKIPLKQIIVSISGEIISEEWV